jgi:hypothetical protein
LSTVRSLLSVFLFFLSSFSSSFPAKSTTLRKEEETVKEE